MDQQRLPRSGDIYRHFKDKLYQIITVATHTETGEAMVVYQALYGDFRSYVRPLSMFISEVDKVKYPEVLQQYRFELWEGRDNRESEDLTSMDTEKTNYDTKTKSEPDAKPSSSVKPEAMIENGIAVKPEAMIENGIEVKPGAMIEKEIEVKNDKLAGEIVDDTASAVNSLLLDFLDADSFNKKLELISINRKHLTDRLINDMAVALDITVDEGPLEERIERLIYSLQTMSRFEDRRLR